MTARRITCNSAPMAGRTPILPQSDDDANWLRIAAERRNPIMARPAHEPPLIWPVALMAVGFVVLALLVAGV